MPKEGQRSITIKEEIYDKVEEQARKEKRSVSNMAEFIFEKFLENES